MPLFYERCSFLPCTSTFSIFLLLQDAVFMHTESERKYEDISRKMATLEADSQRGNERADGAEKKISVGHHIVKGNGKNNILI